jgi:hypothetical protein
MQKENQMTGHLPPRPERNQFETEEEYQEALSGWNHRIRPLLTTNRSPDFQSKYKYQESEDSKQKKFEGDADH